MHKIPFTHASRIVAFLGAALGLMLLSGCGLTISNVTPPTAPENPSEIYTISARVEAKPAVIIPSSIRPRIFIDGQSYPMQKSSVGTDLYDFDYHMPAGRDTAAYYFIVTYQTSSNGTITTHDAYTDVFNLKLIRRDVLPLQVNRGPVGARISLLGRGFTPQDVVYFEGTPARTVYESATSLSFFVPSVDADHNYKVLLNGSAPVGTFRVDPTVLTVAPTSLTLRPGETQNLTFTLPNPAPSGGLLLDLTTDVPESVIMPEVVVPEGQTSVTVPVQGGKAGSGALYLKGFGTGELTVPITVK